MGIGIAGLCCIGIILFVVFGGLFSGESNMSPDQIKQNAKPVTIETLNNDSWGSLDGKPVSFTGEINEVGTEGLVAGTYKVRNIQIGSYGYNTGSINVIVKTDNGVNISNWEVVNVTGIYEGKKTYPLGNVDVEMPTVRNATIVGTGQIINH